MTDPEALIGGTFGTLRRRGCDFPPDPQRKAQARVPLLAGFATESRFSGWFEIEEAISMHVSQCYTAQ
jgi:hypothetical protein